ncbi:MAG TPA: hypothetical protein VLF40_05140, partial [Candidatus Saccharimonadales bacterium]|nr:hypothetical protein [Candidatus Saccharimonadales bacterium]
TAVENSNHNFELKGIGFRALQSDAFKALTADATFDLILATPPYLDGPIENPLDYAVHGTTHFLQEFLSGARAHLNASGKVLITYAEWGLLSQFEDLLAANKWSSKIIDSRASADGARVYRLYELS